MTIDDRVHKKIGRLYSRGWEKVKGKTWYHEDYGFKTTDEAIKLEEKRRHG